MKKYIDILYKAMNMGLTAVAGLAFVTVMAAGCSDKDEPETVPEVVVGQVELSSPQIVFDVDGGTRTVLVNTNAEWYFDCDYTWIAISADLEANTVTISAEKNTSGENRYGVVSVICGDKGYTDKRDIQVMQTYEPEDLVTDGVTANCYIAGTDKAYRFPAKVKGNGGKDGNSRYIEAAGVEISGAAYAELIWEATLDGDKTRSTYVIDGDPMFDGENVYFSTGKTAGNAVIAVCAADGTVLWSWHIWVTDDSIATKTDANGLVWMDRNLGALSAKAAEGLNTRGLFYQWGRKDPFLPSAAEYVQIPSINYDDDEATQNAKYAEQVELRPKANVANVQYGNGKRAHATDETLFNSTAPATVVYAVEHPETFLTGYSVYVGGTKYDWYCVSPDESLTGQSTSNLWGNTTEDVAYKSIFDPCPAGYVVPKANAFATLGDSDAYKLVSTVYGDNDEVVSTPWTEDEDGYGWYWADCENAFFPKAGMIGVMGSLSYTNECVYYWTADPMPSTKDVWGRSHCLFTNQGRLFFGIEYYGNSYYDPYSYGARAFGGSVRCVKE